MIYLVCTLLFALTTPAFATQTFQVRDGQTVTAIISQRELTRISIAGLASLQKVWVAGGIGLKIQTDEDQGDIFIQPPAHAFGNLSFFVRDTDGGTYTILAEIQDVPSETIILKPHAVLSNPLTSPQRRPKTYSYVRDIKRLVFAMAKHKAAKGFTRNEDKTAVPLWHEATLTRVAVYTGFHFHGHVYTLENVSAHPLIIHEQEFLDLLPDTRAVALTHSRISQGHRASIYIVQNAPEETFTSPDSTSVLDTLTSSDQ